MNNRLNSWRCSAIFVTFGLAIAHSFVASGAVARAHSCADLFLPSRFELLIPGTKLAFGPQYFVGTEAERTAHAATMNAAGRDGVEKLIGMYSNSIPLNRPVVEIGPFLNPLGQTLTERHKWIVWEYDQMAAQKIADSRDALVFRLDLNSLNDEQWIQFLKANQIALKDALPGGLNLGITLISSVLNYIDYDIVLKKIIQNTADAGLVIIGNTNVGDKDMMRGRKAPNGSQILEHLLVHYPNQVEILPGTKLTLDSMDGSRTGIELAVRIHKNSGLRNRHQDLYAQGIEIYTSFRVKPFELKYPQLCPRLKYEEILSFWESKDPTVVANEIAAIKANKHYYRNDLPRNLQAEIAYDLERRNEYIVRVLSAQEDSLELMNLKSDLFSPAREFFLPERDTLLSALALKPGFRAGFLKHQLTYLYSKLGHSLDQSIASLLE